MRLFSKKYLILLILSLTVFTPSAFAPPPGPNTPPIIWEEDGTAIGYANRVDCQDNITCAKNGNKIEIDTSGASVAGSDSQIQYNNGGSFGGDSDNTWDDTNKTHEIGVQSSVASGVVSTGPNQTISQPTGGGQAALYEDKASSSSSSGATLILASHDGAANASGDRLGGIQFGGQRTASGTSRGAEIEAFAEELWTNTSAASKLCVSTVPTGSTSRSERFCFEGDGTFSSSNATYETLVNSDDDIPNKKYVDDNDDDVPESGDFGNAADLETTGALSDDVVAAAEMANADHGDVAWSGGVATVEAVSGPNAVNSDAYVDGSVDEVHTSFRVAAGTDPDVGTAGDDGLDTDDHAHRGYDGSNQFVYGQKIKSITATIATPLDLDEADNLELWTNRSGFTFTITELHARSNLDNVDFVLKEMTDLTDFSSPTTIKTEVIDQDGTGVFYNDGTTTITHATIENDHSIAFDNDGTDDPDYITIDIVGYFDGDVA